LFRKHLRNESVFVTKAKLFLKRKYFNLQTKVKVFTNPKKKFFLNENAFIKKKVAKESVLETNIVELFHF